MKKILIYSIIIVLVIIAMIAVYVSNNIRQMQEVQNLNKEYEIYENKEVYGTNVTTIINKAIDSNVKNEIPKDEKGFFIENNKNSIKIELIMLNEDRPVTYQMETIQKTGITGFVKNFNLIKFKCTKIEYHNETKRISKIIFEQIEQ